MAGAAASVSILSELDPHALFDFTYNAVMPVHVAGKVTEMLNVFELTVTGPASPLISAPGKAILQVYDTAPAVAVGKEKVKVPPPQSPRFRPETGTGTPAVAVLLPISNVLTPALSPKQFPL